MEQYQQNGLAVCGRAELQINGNTLEYRVPKAVLGIKGPFTIRFKAADNVKEPLNMQSYYVNGCVAPVGRLGFIFRG